MTLLSTNNRNRRWLLARRPSGAITVDDFLLNEISVSKPASGEILVRNDCLSCDPAQQGWMTVDTYLPAMRPGEVIRSIALGEVIASGDPAFRPGDRVQGLFGWQDYAVVRPGDGPYPILPVSPDVSDETGLSALGSTGITAYFGLLEIGRPRPGETVVVSAAAGATGSVVGQIAKIVGCRTIGIAGGPDKCRYLTDQLGFDAAIDYRSENVVTRLRETCPRGIDVYYDNVGGRVLDAALLHLARNGRVVICGAISGYGQPGGPPGPRNYFRLLTQRGRMEGFVVLDYLARAGEATAAIAGWMREGRLKDRVDVMHGFENAPAALARVFSGANQGKQVLKIAEGRAA
jgi:NADPH-dependent curcumin reductase CurA